MNLVLIRGYEPEYSHGLLICGSLRLMTIERPWIENPAGPGGMPRVSCIPEGGYVLSPYDSPAKPRTYEIVNHELGVYGEPWDIPRGQGWGRANCLIHAGNFVTDVIGCIAVGLVAGQISGKPAVKSSQAAMDELRSKLGRTEVHTLQIVRASEVKKFSEGEKDDEAKSA